MITVRFPNGQAVQYNDARCVTYPTQTCPFTRLYTKEAGGRLVACVPCECIVEFQRPCRVYNPIEDRKDSKTADEITKLSRKVSRALTAAKKMKAAK